MIYDILTNQSRLVKVRVCALHICVNDVLRQCTAHQTSVVVIEMLRTLLDKPNLEKGEALWNL